MGYLGSLFFDFNFNCFGFLAYIYPLGIMYLGYLYYRNKKLTLRFVEISLAFVLFFMILLIIQASLIQKGVFGQAIVLYLKPYLGNFGIWILSILGIITCLISISDQDIVQIFKTTKPLITKKCNTFFQSILKTGIPKLLTLFKKLCFVSKSKLASLKINLKPKITQSPFVELPQHTQVDLKNLLPQTNQQSNTPQESKKIQYKDEIKPHKEKIMFKKDEKINIQEFVIAQKKEEKKTTIRILEDTQLPKKENPFLKAHFPLQHSQEISTSAELLKKIKNEEFNPNIDHSNNQPSTQTHSHTLDTSTFLNTPNLSTQNIAPQDTKASNLSDITNQQYFCDKDSNLDLSPSIPPLEQDSINITQMDCVDFVTPQTKEYVANSSSEDLALDIQNDLQTQTPKKTSTIVPPTQEMRSKIAHIKTLKENEALLREIDQGQVAIPKDYKLPPLNLLSTAPAQKNEINEMEIDSKIQNLLAKLNIFKIEGDVICTYSGPIITTLEFRPAPHVKVSRIQNLEDDLAMALEAKSIRIQAPIPGKNVVGIEIPNSSIQTIYLREIFESEIFKNSSSPLTLALGKDVVGNPFVTDLKKLPHLLIAGTTGSGKSVGVNAMILSLLYRNSPDDLKLMMVDPKMVEFMPYSDLPHLITPIITDPKKAVIGLANAVKEMERRYTLMSQSRTKEIVGYNQKAQELGMEKFPYFVIIIDELADLMMTAGKEVEYSMARIAQMGRASGMHLIVATQSPRADILTGLIKTNLPSHLSYKVGTKIDAGIIGCPGAETLLGRGDMLFTPPGGGLVRLHAPWSSEDEVNHIVEYIKSQREVQYDSTFLPEEKELLGALDDCDLDSETLMLLEKAKEIILRENKTSISYIQRRLSIGFNKAANLFDILEKQGFLSPPDAKNNRSIL